MFLELENCPSALSTHLSPLWPPSTCLSPLFLHRELRFPEEDRLSEASHEGSEWGTTAAEKDSWKAWALGVPPIETTDPEDRLSCQL